MSLQIKSKKSNNPQLAKALRAWKEKLFGPELSPKTEQAPWQKALEKAKAKTEETREWRKPNRPLDLAYELMIQEQEGAVTNLVYEENDDLDFEGMAVEVAALDLSTMQSEKRARAYSAIKAEAESFLSAVALKAQNPAQRTALFADSLYGKYPQLEIRALRPKDLKELDCLDYSSVLNPFNLQDLRINQEHSDDVGVFYLSLEELASELVLAEKRPNQAEAARSMAKQLAKITHSRTEAPLIVYNRERPDAFLVLFHEVLHFLQSKNDHQLFFGENFSTDLQKNKLYSKGMHLLEEGKLNKLTEKMKALMAPLALVELEVGKIISDLIPQYFSDYDLNPQHEYTLSWLPVFASSVLKSQANS